MRAALTERQLWARHCPESFLSPTPSKPNSVSMRHTLLDPIPQARKQARTMKPLASDLTAGKW